MAEPEIKLAVNLYDLDRCTGDLRTSVAKRVDVHNPIKTDWDRKAECATDERAVVFTCSLISAAVLCDLMRSHDREAGDFPTRLYIKRKEWSRIPSHVVLTVVRGGKAVLNPDFFKVELDVAPATELESQVITFGD